MKNKFKQRWSTISPTKRTTTFHSYSPSIQNTTTNHAGVPDHGLGEAHNGGGINLANGISFIPTTQLPTTWYVTKGSQGLVYLTDHRVCDKSNTTGVTNGAVNCLPFRCIWAHLRLPSSYCSLFNFLCMLCLIVCPSVYGFWFTPWMS